jgi:hypothetical protein
MSFTRHSCSFYHFMQYLDAIALTSPTSTRLGHQHAKDV